MELSVVVVDSQQLIRMALSSILPTEGIQIVGSAPDAISAVRLTLRFRPKVAVIDILLRGRANGIQLAHQLRKIDSRIGIVFLTSVEDLRTLGPAIEEMPNGSIFLNKADVNDAEQIRDGIRKASNNAHSALLSVGSKLKLRNQPFTDNQMELMRMIALGMLNKSIATKRFTTVKSTENAISRLAKKMNMPIKKPASFDCTVLLCNKFMRSP